MKIQPIPLSKFKTDKASTVHRTAFAIFTLVRKVGAAASEVPDALQSSARDVATAWADSRPKS